MTHIPPTEDINVDDAVAFCLQYLRDRINATPPPKRDYGYDIFASSIAMKWAYRVTRGDSMRTDQVANDVGPIFFEATWELCRRGIVRPGVWSRLEQGNPEGGGYCLTTYGERWLSNADDGNFIIMQPGSLASTLSKFSDKFGDGFHQRANEAIACRRAEAWLACCAMVGAAAEAVALAIAIAKTGDEDEVIRTYQARDGRRQVSNLIIGQHPQHLKISFQTFMGLLAYWRDDASHGQAVTLSVANSDEALRQLLHFCQWTERNWDLLTVAP